MYGTITYGIGTCPSLEKVIKSLVKDAPAAQLSASAAPPPETLAVSHPHPALDGTDTLALVNPVTSILIPVQ